MRCDDHGLLLSILFLRVIEARSDFVATFSFLRSSKRKRVPHLSTSTDESQSILELVKTSTREINDYITFFSVKISFLKYTSTNDYPKEYQASKSKTASMERV